MENTLSPEAVQASAIRVHDRVRTLYGYLSVTFAHSEGVSVCLHLTKMDGDTLIYHVDPSKEFEVIRDEAD